MKIGIIGCGYVGQAIALQWKQQGHQIFVTTRQPEKVSYLKKFANQVYLLGVQSLAAFIVEQEILLISVAPDHVSDYTSTYLETAKQVAEQVVPDSSVQQIIYISSTSVYGNHDGAWVDENTPIQCSHENGKILYATEQTLLQCSSPSLQVCILRLGEIYGPGREIEQRIKRTQHQPFAGTGQSYTNLIHLTDIVNAIDFAHKNHLQGIYNLCNDFHIPRAQFYEQICQKENLPLIQWDPQRTNLHAGNRRVSNQKIKNAGFIFSNHQYFE